MNHLERTSFDQNMRATSEVSLLLLLVVGRQFELQDEKITEKGRSVCHVYATVGSGSQKRKIQKIHGSSGKHKLIR